MTEKVVKLIQVQCPHLCKPIIVVATYGIVRALNMTGEKLLKYDCDYTDECNCTCPMDPRYKAE